MNVIFILDADISLNFSFLAWERIWLWGDLICIRNPYYFSSINTDQSHCRCYPILILFPILWVTWPSRIAHGHGLMMHMVRAQSSFSPPTLNISLFFTFISCSCSPFFLLLKIDCLEPMFMPYSNAMLFSTIYHSRISRFCLANSNQLVAARILWHVCF